MTGDCYGLMTMNNEERSAAEHELSSPRASSGSILGNYPESVGATEDQVNMAYTAPQRLDSHGVSAVDLAGTGEHDTLGG